MHGVCTKAILVQIKEKAMENLGPYNNYYVLYSRGKALILYYLLAITIKYFLSTK